MAAAWWSRAPELIERALRGPSRPGESQRYQFGSGHLELDSDDEPLNRRFGEIYPEGVTARRDGAPCVRVRVRCLEEPAVAAIAFEDPEDLDTFEFCRALFPDRNYVDGPPAVPGWRTLSLDGRPEPLIAINRVHAVADRRQSWQPLVANLAVNRVLRLQRDLLFFHGASAAVGSQGLLFLGGKGSGKTTTSLTLASRGHGFLGDEIAAVRLGDRAMLPFRRAASIRAGARADRLERRLEEGSFARETFPDGSARVLASVAHLFPEAQARETRLSAAFFLRGFAPAPRLEPFDFGLEHLSLLTPLACSLWGTPAGLRILQLTRLMRDVRCYYLNPGSPDDTAQLLEQLAKELAA